MVLCLGEVHDTLQGFSTFLSVLFYSGWGGGFGPGEGMVDFCERRKADDVAVPERDASFVVP
jgi:hypothetical protein